jgi:hypothetical protein
MRHGHRGTVSPVIHRLLHPRYGPWVSVRAALLLRGQPFGPIADAAISATFQPCSTCARPCLQACPAQVHDGAGHSSFDRCHEPRAAGGCTDCCQVVRTCPIGSSERAPADVERARHGEEREQLQRRHGRGLWSTLRRTFGR